MTDDSKGESHRAYVMSHVNREVDAEFEMQEEMDNKLMTDRARLTDGEIEEARDILKKGCACEGCFENKNKELICRYARHLEEEVEMLRGGNYKTACVGCGDECWVRQPDIKIKACNECLWKEADEQLAEQQDAIVRLRAELAEQSARAAGVEGSND